MKSILKKSALFVAAFVTTVAFAGERHIAERLPEDTYAVFSIKDISGFKEKFAKTSNGLAMQSPEGEVIKERVIDTMMNRVDRMMSDTFGIKGSDLAEHFQGGVVIFGTHLKAYMQNDTGFQEFDLCMVAEVPKDDHREVRKTITAILEEFAEEAEKSVEEFRGHKIYTLEMTEKITSADLMGTNVDAPEVVSETKYLFQYAFTDDYFIFLEGPNKPAKKIINALTNDEADRLKDTEAYSFVASKTDHLGDVGLFVDVPFLFNYWENMPFSEFSAYPNLKEVHLTDFGPLGISHTMRGDGSADYRFAVQLPRNKEGLMELLTAGDENPLQLASIVPADVVTFSSWTLDVGKAWQVLMGVIMESPQGQGAFINMMIQQTNQMLSVDLEEDILANIAGEHATYSKKSDESSQSYGMAELEAKPLAVILGTKGGDETVKTFDTVLDNLAKEPYQFPLEKSVQRGFSVWKPKDPMMGQIRPEAIIAPNRLIIASTGTETQEMLRQLSASGGSSLAADEEYQRVVGEFPKSDLRFFQFYPSRHFEQLATDMRTTIGSLGDFLPGGELLGEMNLDPSIVPDADWWREYFGPSGSALYVEPDALVFHSRGLVPE